MQKVQKSKQWELPFKLSLADQSHPQRWPLTVSYESLWKYFIHRQTRIYDILPILTFNPISYYANGKPLSTKMLFPLNTIYHGVHTILRRSFPFISKLYHIASYGYTIRDFKSSLLRWTFSLFSILCYFYYHLLTWNSLGKFDSFFNRVWVHNFIQNTQLECFICQNMSS